MDRLSARIDNFQGELDEIAFINPDDPEGMYNLRDIVKYFGDERLYKIAERFCAYEDTGLEPDEIPHWIPVSERLPEHSGIYLIFAFGKTIRTAFYDREIGWDAEFECKFKQGNITHWMPLPLPPKEEK